MTLLATPSLPALVLLLALILDATLGEYPNALHPVVWMGKVIGALERRAPRGRTAQLLYGALIAALVPLLFAGPALLLLGWVNLPGVVIVPLAVFLLKASLALTALGQAAAVVRRALGYRQLPQAREGLRSLCSRDPSALSSEELAAATIESVAENASDSFVAPLFYYALFGVPGALFYRAVNTMDAMIGYHGKYEYLGKAAARLDDLLNLIPARLTALLLLAAGALRGQDVRAGVSIWRRDARRTESPNAGRPMATMAGLLGVQLAKPGHYVLGDAREPLAPVKIDAAWGTVKLACALMMLGTLAWLYRRHGFLL